MRLAIAALALASCIKSASVTCDDGTVCPPDTACVTLTVPAVHAEQCVPAGATGACPGTADFAPCTLATGVAGTCYATTNGHACLPGGCGNGITDPTEVCDDGNAVAGDGCSDSCMSNETCGNGIVDPGEGELCDDGNVQSHDGCAFDCAAPESGAWTLIGTSSLGLPSLRDDVAMAFDPISARTILFGGANTPTFYGDTWAYDGATWSQLDVTGPTARGDARMVYDDARKRLVLFGGDVSGATMTSTNYEFFEDTWEWDGSRWSVVSSPDKPHPPGRSGHAMAYDPIRKRVVVYGGQFHLPVSISLKNDTWEWDGSTWTPGPDGPGVRAGSAMAFDPVSGQMIMFGGGNTSETWTYDGITWTQLFPAASPPARSYAVMTTDPKTGHVLLYGGQGLTDLWSWDGHTWSLLASNGPDALAGFTTDFDRRRAVLYAAPNQDTREWDGTTLAQNLPTNPNTVRNQATAYDTLRARAVIFGGGGAANPRTSNTLFEIDHMRWITPNITSAKPVARASAGMAYDLDKRVTLMFGGNTSVSTDTSSGTALGDTWTWDGTGWTPLTTGAQPPARTMPALAYDVARAQVVMFGGDDNSSQALADTWLWNGTWIQAQATTPPPARAGASLAYDPIRQQTVMFGGTDTVGTTLDDTWVWDGATWTQILTAQGPLPRANAALAWSPDRERLILFGGHDSIVSATADTWEWEGTTWSPLLLATAPPARGGASMFPTRDGKGLLVYAGVVKENNGAGLADVWMLSWSSPEIVDDNCADQADSDNDGRVGCADQDCWATCTPTCEPGTVCDPAAPHCGDGVCSAVFETCLSCPSDCTCTPLCGDFRCDPGESCLGDCGM